jgi:hypothetical protein
MEEFLVLGLVAYLIPPLRSGIEPPIPRIDPDIEIISSPEKMYLHSLSTRERLPDEFHEAMMLWSFDPSQSMYCQMYLDWVDHCDKMRKGREKFEKNQRIMDRILFCSVSLCFAALLLVLAQKAFQ